MLTNLLAAVVITLVTNVVPTDNAVYAPDYSIALTSFPAQYGNRLVTPATERYLTTNVTEHTEITLTLADGKQTFTHERLLSSVYSILRKREEWENAGVRTNATMVQAFTNVIHFASPGVIIWREPATMTNDVPPPLMMNDDLIRR